MSAGRLGRLRERLHVYWRKILAEHTSPGRLAAAVLVGAIAGCTPFFGFHLPLCVALAWLLGLNKVTVYAVANISIPPTAPLLGFASVQVGERLLHGRFLPLSVAEFRGRPLGALVARFFVDWLAGSLVVGTALGAVLASVVYVIAARRRARMRAHPATEVPSSDDAARSRDPVVAAALRAASARYRAAPRPLRMYAWFKYRLDPCYRRIAALVPDGAVAVDLGTGLGMLPLVLALLPGRREAIGVDWDRPKLAAGRAAARGLDRVTLLEGDARTAPLPPCDVITLVDVLHYYDAATQRDLLARCAAALRPGGLLLLREGDAARARGARWTRFVEWLAVGLGWNRGEGRTRFRPTAELAAELAALGFTVTSGDASGRLHPGNQLLVARRPGPPVPPGG